ncbi:hypothetical protein C0989_003371 [Termitomyces sp. Mn162]|nr:hypothetical protein C0989_003371 [Termitomyces sp. Mn162]
MVFSFNLGTPINTALFAYILYSVQHIVFPTISRPKTIPHEFKSGYSWMPKSHPPTVLFKNYSPKTLEPFNGKDGGRILLAINGIVFDVTAGRNFYGPSESATYGMYGNFAGRDASRGMAKQSFDIVDQPIDSLEDLKPDEIDNMKG